MQRLRAQEEKVGLKACVANADERIRSEMSQCDQRPMGRRRSGSWLVPRMDETRMSGEGELLLNRRSDVSGCAEQLGLDRPRGVEGSI